jgi:hypothetical protein
MKAKAVYLILSFVVCGVYPQEKALITTDVLNIRSAPSLNSQVVQKYKFGDIVYIFDERGSGEIIDNELDLWYKISETRNLWMNALYINKFPFFIKSDEIDTERFERNMAKGVLILGTDDEYKCVLKINDCITENNKKYLTGSVVYCPEAPEEVFKNITVELDYELPVFNTYIKVLDSNYNNMQELSNDIIYITCKEMEKEIIASYGELSDREEYQTSNFFAYYSKYFGIIRFSFSTQKYTLKYGIKVGRNLDYIKRILGEPYKIDGNKLMYKNFTRMNESKIIFETDNDIIISITWIADI